MQGVWDLGLLVLLAVVVGGVFGLLGSVIGSFFVLRTRRDGYEPLIPPLKTKEVAMEAHNMDDILSEADVTNEIEKIFSQRAEEDPNNPFSEANKRMKEQMNV